MWARIISSQSKNTVHMLFNDIHDVQDERGMHSLLLSRVYTNRTVMIRC